MNPTGHRIQVARLFFVFSTVGITVITVGVTIVSAMGDLTAIILVLLPLIALEFHVAAFASLGLLANSFLEKVFLSGDCKDKFLIAIYAN